MQIELPIKLIRTLRELKWDNAHLTAQNAHEYNTKKVSLLDLEHKDIIKVMELLKKDHWESDDNRRTFYELRSFEKLFSGKGMDGTKIKNLKSMSVSLTKVLSTYTNKWFFKKDRGLLSPKLITSVIYHPKETYRNERVVPAWIGINYASYSRGSVDTGTIRVDRGDLTKNGCTVHELIASLGIVKPDPDLIASHNAMIEKYNTWCKQTGEQFLARGRALSEDRWSGEYSLEKEGNPTKAVMDDSLGYEDKTNTVDMSFWGKRSVASITETDEDDEESKAESEAELEVMEEPAPVFPLVQVFDLLEHKHVTVTVEQLEPYVYDEKVGDKLVLPSDDRKLIETLVRSVDMQGEDIIRGKSGGVMILLSGAPGSGKTLTAEVTAEIAKRPLYTVQCAQLTFNPSEIEKELLEVLKNALRWKAILLIDEADIFVHARGDDMEQNAVVGVFLRLLEYYKGILFMNTNRGADIDDAIRSRAIAHVEYELLSWNKDKERESVEKLWAVLTSQYGVEFADETERTYTLTEFPKLSGRTIKQLIRLCKTAHPGEKLTAGMIKWAAKYQRLAIKGTDE